jgi:hypothetical protein
MLYPIELRAHQYERKKYFLSGRQDSNLRPPAPKAGAMNRATLRPEKIQQYYLPIIRT